jgi:hypothetical protein
MKYLHNTTQRNIRNLFEKAETKSFIRNPEL